MFLKEQINIPIIVMEIYLTATIKYGFYVDKIVGEGVLVKFTFKHNLPDIFLRFYFIVIENIVTQIAK